MPANGLKRWRRREDDAMTDLFAAGLEPRPVVIPPREVVVAEPVEMAKAVPTETVAPTPEPAQVTTAPEVVPVLYLMAFPPPDVRSLIAQRTRQLCRQQRLEGKLQAASRLHVSLAWLGVEDRVDVDRIVEAMGQVTAAPFEVAFDEAVCFGRGDRTRLTLTSHEGNDGVARFGAELESVLSDAGIDHEPLFDNPHMTLGYFDRPLEARATEPLGWLATEIALVRSHKGEGRYDIIGRWPLKKPASRSAKPPARRARRSATQSQPAGESCFAAAMGELQSAA